MVVMATIVVGPTTIRECVMILGECGHIGSICEDCGQALDLQVLKSAAGWYLGTSCDCGPYSRESRYFKTKEQARFELELQNEPPYEEWSAV